MFTPPPDKIGKARQIVQATDDAAALGTGAAAFEGRMIDEASRRMPYRVLARAGVSIEV